MVNPMTEFGWEEVVVDNMLNRDERRFK